MGLFIHITVRIYRLSYTGARAGICRAVYLIKREWIPGYKFQVEKKRWKEVKEIGKKKGKENITEKRL
jgi:hypothetical protein